MSPQTSVVISDTNATDVTRAFAITVLSNAVFSAVTGGVNLSGFAGVTLPAGVTIYVTGLTSVTLASGVVLVYKM